MRLEIFGYVLEFKKNAIKQLKAQGGGRVMTGCKITQRDGHLLLTDGKGQVLPKQVDLTIVSNTNGPMMATCTFFISGLEEQSGLKI